MKSWFSNSNLEVISMHVHQSNDNDYFTIKAEIKFDVDTMF